MDLVNLLFAKLNTAVFSLNQFASNHSYIHFSW